MLSLFPDLLTYGQIAPTLMRLVLTVILIHWAYRSFRGSGNSNYNVVWGVTYGVLGILFLVGIFTQFAAAVSVIILGVELIRKIINKSFLTDGINYYLIMFMIALSLLFTGAGFIAFDASF